MTINAFDAKAAQIVPQNVEKLPLFHWQPGKRLLTVGSRDGASFGDDFAAAEKNTFLRPLTAELLAVSQEKMATDGLCATFASSLFYPENLRLMAAHKQGFFAMLSPGFGDPALLDEIADDLDAVLLLLGPKPGPLTERIMNLDCHVEVLWGIDEQVPTLDLAWDQVAAVHMASLRPHGAQVELRAEWYAAARACLPAAVAVYDDDHSHSICACGETLIWRSGGRSRVDQLDLASGRCLSCNAETAFSHEKKPD